MNEANNKILEFGYGALVVDTGTYDNKPAVFVKAALEAGPVGERTHDRERTSLDELVPGEVVLTFPTEQQAQAVADTLCQPTFLDIPEFLRKNAD